jgi:hypothetical protein
MTPKGAGSGRDWTGEGCDGGGEVNGVGAWERWQAVFTGCRAQQAQRLFLSSGREGGRDAAYSYFFGGEDAGLFWKA